MLRYDLSFNYDSAVIENSFFVWNNVHSLHNWKKYWNVYNEKRETYAWILLTCFVNSNFNLETKSDQNLVITVVKDYETINES